MPMLQVLTLIINNIIAENLISQKGCPPTILTSLCYATLLYGSRHLTKRLSPLCCCILIHFGAAGPAAWCDHHGAQTVVL